MTPDIMGRKKHYEFFLFLKMSVLCTFDWCEQKSRLPITFSVRVLKVLFCLRHPPLSEKVTLMLLILHGAFLLMENLEFLCGLHQFYLFSWTILLSAFFG